MSAQGPDAGRHHQQASQSRERDTFIDVKANRRYDRDQLTPIREAQLVSRSADYVSPNGTLNDDEAGARFGAGFREPGVLKVAFVSRFYESTALWFWRIACNDVRLNSIETLYDTQSAAALDLV